MRFVIDLDSLEVIESTSDRRRVTQVEGKRGDDSPFEVIFVRAGVAEELAGSSVLTFGAKQAGKYDGTAVVLNNDFALSGAETTAKYLASPSFNTAALNDLFVIDGDDSNDIPYVDLMAEFTWNVGAGAPSSTKTFTFRVHNDVIRGDELTPTPLPEPIGGTAPVNDALSVSGEAYAQSGFASLISWPIMRASSVDFGKTGFLNSDGYGASATWDEEAHEWNLVGYDDDGNPGYWYSTDDVPTPDLVTSWTPRTAEHGTILLTITPGTQSPPYIRVSGGFLFIQESGIWKKTALSSL